eukprot:evm.model.scf_816.3 EVM.evm.TU.scf_816.3   scf_816:24362-31618(-)
MAHCLSTPPSGLGPCGLAAPTGLKPLRWPRGARSRRRGGQEARALDPDSLSAMLPQLQNLVRGLHLAYDPVALPCSTMKCGDIIYRSSLDPALRMENDTISPLGAALLAAVGLYLLAPPGVLAALFDLYVINPLQRIMALKVHTRNDIRLGRKLAAGGFGIVYKGELKEGNGRTRDVVVKKAKEFGEAEVWMNERVMRVPGRHCAEFITAFEDKAGGREDPLWIVWKYEGDYTLWDLMQKKDFPYNLEPYLFKGPLNMPEGPYRQLVTVKLAMKQILEALKSSHGVGIVHRDIKPQNCIISDQDKKIKLIDLGAAADLRTGINYVANEFLLDPRYAPPQQYIMSTQTPKAPAAPIAALLAPVLWQLELPDRFDMYSAGMILLQMAFPALRSDNSLIAFNRKLESLNYDMKAWRKLMEGKNNREYTEGFELLDMNGRAGWDLVRRLLAYNPRKRPSASDALGHRWFGGLGGYLDSIGDGIEDLTTPVLEEMDVSDALVGTARTVSGVLTEGQLAEELGFRDRVMVPQKAGSSTIAWWKDRQEDVDKKIQDKERIMRQLASNVRNGRLNARKTVRESGAFFNLFSKRD